jgi:hypothetical protein
MDNKRNGQINTPNNIGADGADAGTTTCERDLERHIEAYNDATAFATIGFCWNEYDERKSEKEKIDNGH